MEIAKAEPKARRQPRQRVRGSGVPWNYASGSTGKQAASPAPYPSLAANVISLSPAATAVPAEAVTNRNQSRHFYQPALTFHLVASTPTTKVCGSKLTPTQSSRKDSGVHSGKVAESVTVPYRLDELFRQEMGLDAPYPRRA